MVLFFLLQYRSGCRSPPRQHEGGWRGPPMEDVLLAVDLERRPVGLHGADLAAGDTLHQTGAGQVIQRARWMTSEQGQRIPAEVGGTLSPAAAAMYELVEVVQKHAPSP